MQHALGRLDDAVASFGKALALAPEATQARCARATVLAALGRHEAAEDDLRLALEAAPDDSHARHNLGVLLAERGQAAAALCEYDRVLGVDPRHAGARANRAALRLARGDAEGALEDYGTLCTDARPAADSRRGLVRALLLLHRDAEALDQAQRLVEQHPEDPLATDLKAIALASLGRLAEAQRCFGGADGRAKARSAFIDRALERQKVCDWSDRSRLVEAIREALADPQPGELASEAVLFHAHALPLRAAELKAISARVAQAIRSSAENLGLGPYIAGPAGGRLRVGFRLPACAIIRKPDFSGA